MSNGTRCHSNLMSLQMARKIAEDVLVCTDCCRRYSGPVTPSVCVALLKSPRPLERIKFNDSYIDQIFQRHIRFTRFAECSLARRQLWQD